jgi:hypothetical protein
VDLLFHARREFNFGSQMLLQSFADFSTDCSALGVINIDGVAHDGPRCPNEPLLRLMKVLTSAISGPLMRAETAAFGYRSHSSQQRSPKNVQKLIRVRNGSLGVGTVSGTFLNVVFDEPVWQGGDAGRVGAVRQGPRKWMERGAK